MDNTAFLWKRYTQEQDLQAREELIIHYAGLVKYVAGRLAVGIPPSLQNEDLISYGTLGLIEAVDRFDPNYGVKFETYAVARIRGQIIDSLRAMDLLPRSVHRQAKEIEAAIAYLSQTLGRVPIDLEIAEHLEISLEQYHNWLLNTNCTIVSLDRPITFDNGEQSTLYDSMEDINMRTPTQQIDDHEQKKALVSAILALPKREQTMISLYYNDGLTMKEIGKVLNVSESRVSQIHTKAMLTLRSLLNGGDTPAPITYDRRMTNARTYAIAT